MASRRALKLRTEVAEATLTNDVKDVLINDTSKALSNLDAKLIDALKAGYVRLLRSTWLLQQPTTYQLQWRQKLEQLDGLGMNSALLTPEEAVALVRCCNRSVGALTYGAVQVKTHFNRRCADSSPSVRQVGSRQAIPIQPALVSKLYGRHWSRTRISRGYSGSAPAP